jgi:hypothetical protein
LLRFCIKKEGLKYNKDGFVLNHEYILELKFIKEGLSWVNFEVPYYVGYDLQDESVKFSNACTYNLEDGKIVKPS